MALVVGVQPPYLDEEAEVMDLLEAYFATGEETVHIDDTTPAELEDLLTDGVIFIRVGRVGGAPDRTEEHTDKPVVDIDVFAATRTPAKNFAQRIEQFLMSKPRPIDECDVLMSPQRVEWAEGSPVRRFYASYHLSLRRPANTLVP